MQTKNLRKVKMLHPTKKDRDGNPATFEVNERTVKSGKAAKMGFLPIEEVQAPPAKVNPATQPKTKKTDGGV